MEKGLSKGVWPYLKSLPTPCISIFSRSFLLGSWESTAITILVRVLSCLIFMTLSHHPLKSEASSLLFTDHFLHFAYGNLKDHYQDISRIIKSTLKEHG